MTSSAATMLEGLAVRSVRCPICLDTFDWPSGDVLYHYEERGGRQPLAMPLGIDELKRRDILRTAELRCPNPSRDTPAHFLPVSYASYAEPLVVGLVGETESGKSHLLAAMIAQIQRGGLQPYGLKVDPVDIGQHEDYLRDRVEPLILRGEKIPGTGEDVTSYADALLITSAAGTRPVAFFDVAGGNLVKTGQPSRFLAGVGALIFVVDPGTALQQRGLGDRSAPREAVRSRDPAFDVVLSRLGAGAQYLDVPAAVVLNKADRLRFQSPVDFWMRRPGNGGRIDSRRLREESRDVYALLYEHNAHAWLRPFHECRRCTLHFASATGGEPDGDRYPRGVRPWRVLDPLVALLAMTGVIPGSESAAVGVL
ncbi:MAG TPA: hypothetical protein VLJ59_03700 [Mycobacteriales bacterium]|nr:hypothetical protein [Mycobacteriales bacterium]